MAVPVMVSWLWKRVDVLSSSIPHAPQAQSLHSLLAENNIQLVLKALDLVSCQQPQARAIRLFLTAHCT